MRFGEFFLEQERSAQGVVKIGVVGLRGDESAISGFGQIVLAGSGVEAGEIALGNCVFGIELKRDLEFADGILGFVFAG